MALTIIISMYLMLVPCLSFNINSLIQHWTLVWNDEFTDPGVDLSKWEFEIGDGCHISRDLCGWGNHELQWYTQENAYTENGNLIIEARNTTPWNSGLEYTSARLRTRGKGDWKYGLVEVRAKLPEGRGIWPAIWMLPTFNKFGRWPRSGAIDIMELVGHDPSTVVMTAHFGRAWNDKSQAGTSFTLRKGKFSDKFHKFSVKWAPNRIKWYVDDKKMYTMTPSDTEGFMYPFNEQFHLLLNVAVGGTFPGNPDESTVFPQRMVVDYVRVWQHK